MLQIYFFVFPKPTEHHVNSQGVGLLSIKLLIRDDQSHMIRTEDTRILRNAFCLISAKLQFLYCPAEAAASQSQNPYMLK